MDNRNPRRSTRARTASEELVQPNKMKSGSRTKQSGLPMVQESPAKRSSGAFSGTTAQNSIIVLKGVDDTAESLVDGLGDLWDISEQLLSKVLVEPFTRDTALQLTAKLKNSPRFQKDILQQYSRLKDAMSRYPGTPISVASTNLRIFNLQNAKDFSEGFHRPDNILYRANLAHAIGILVEKIVEGMDDFDSDDMLRLFFGTFSRVLKSHEEAVSGSTSCLKATFELALELQISAFFQMLDDAADEGQDDFDALRALDESFYKGSDLRGWDIPGLRYKDLTKAQRNAIIDRVNKIHSRFDKNQDLQDLREAVSDTMLIYRCFSWARERNIELLRQMGQVPDGLLGTQEAIDAEITRTKSSQPNKTTQARKSLAQPTFFHPDALPKVGTSARDKAPPSIRTTYQASRQQSSEEQSAVTAPAYQTEQDAASIDANDGFEPAQFVGDEGGAEDDYSVIRETEHYDPTEEEKMILSQYLAKKTRQANKENLPRNFVSSNERSTRLDKGKGKRLHEEIEPEDDGNDSEFSRDGDSVFVTQQTPERSNRQRRRMNPMPTRAGPSQVSLKNTTRRVTYNASRSDSPERISRTQRTDKYNAVNQEAKLRVAELKLKNPPKPRIPWSAEEIECLLEYIEEFATGWARIKEEDLLNRNILHCRDQVALKDKARNMKLDFLKANKPLPPNFDYVPLKKADIEKLRAMGHYDVHTGYDNQE